MRKFTAVLAAAAALALATSPIATAGADKDCSDFPTQRAAQKWFMKHNPRLDPSGLDADNDGIACEDNP
jgi:excalibur calcium-binding domain-containing protein